MHQVYTVAMGRDFSCLLENQTLFDYPSKRNTYAKTPPFLRISAKNEQNFTNMVVDKTLYDGFLE